MDVDAEGTSRSSSDADLAHYLATSNRSPESSATPSSEWTDAASADHNPDAFANSLFDRELAFNLSWSEEDASKYTTVPVHYDYGLDYDLSDHSYTPVTQSNATSSQNPWPTNLAQNPFSINYAYSDLHPLAISDTASSSTQLHPSGYLTPLPPSRSSESGTSNLSTHTPQPHRHFPISTHESFIQNLMSGSDMHPHSSTPFSRQGGEETLQPRYVNLSDITASSPTVCRPAPLPRSPEHTDIQKPMGWIPRKGRGAGVRRRGGGNSTTRVAPIITFTDASADAENEEEEEAGAKVTESPPAKRLRSESETDDGIESPDTPIKKRLRARRGPRVASKGDKHIIDVDIESDAGLGESEADDSDVYEPSRSPSLAPLSPSAASSPGSLSSSSSFTGSPAKVRGKSVKSKGKGRAKGSAALALLKFKKERSSSEQSATGDGDEWSGDGSQETSDGKGKRKRKNQSIPLPIPVPNLIKKSRGRKVPYVAGSSPVDDEDDIVNVDTKVKRKGRGRKGVDVGSAEEGKRSYVCTVPGCGKCFVRGEHLKRHVRSIHTYEKPHPCPYEGCDKTFSRRDNLGQHVRIHL